MPPHRRKRLMRTYAVRDRAREGTKDGVDVSPKEQPDRSLPPPGRWTLRGGSLPKDQHRQSNVAPLFIQRKRTEASSLEPGEVPSTIGDQSTRCLPSSHHPKLTQLTLDLGQRLRMTCPDCSMSYHPSNPSDTVLHATFHAKVVGGVDFSVARPPRIVWEGSGPGTYITIVDRRSSAADKRKAYEVLSVVNTELSAADIPETVLWASDDRYRLYLYVTVGRTAKRPKVVGALLAERIEKAYPVKRGRGVSLSDSERKAVLGVSRIWTCVSNRRTGVAKRLLEAAQASFIYGMAIAADHVAFSQPTESGEMFARAITRTADDAQDDSAGWMVYREQL